MSTEGATAWRQERRLEQEQKAKQLQDALESASSPEDRYAAAQAIYGPSVFKQHAENLFGRLIGRTPQPIVNPAAPPSVTTMQGGITPSDAADLSGVSNAGQPAPTKAAPGIGDDSQLPALPAPMPNGGIGARRFWVRVGRGDFHASQEQHGRVYAGLVLRLRRPLVFHKIGAKLLPGVENCHLHIGFG